MTATKSTAVFNQALHAGIQLEEFVIERVLGSGGFGITYLARDTRLNRQVVIKENLPVQFCFRDTHALTVAPRQTTGDDADNFQWSLENFSKEAATLASLDHPGIVKVLRSFEAFGTAYFVMPYLEGITLDEAIRERRGQGRRFSEAELLGLLERVLDALAYLHERGIYHRDIKPGNLLITSGGLPVLIDFGSARQRLSERSMTVIESAGYTPFEQLQTRGNVGPWSDLYALAATLVKVMTEEAPPKAQDRSFGDPWRPLADNPVLAERFSQPFLTGLDRALQLPTEQRWQSADDWKAGLRGIAIAGEPRPNPHESTATGLKREEKVGTTLNSKQGSGEERRGKANGKFHNIRIAVGLIASAAVGGIIVNAILAKKQAADRQPPVISDSAPDIGTEQPNTGRSRAKAEATKQAAKPEDAGEIQAEEAAALAAQEREAESSRIEAAAERLRGDAKAEVEDRELALEGFALIPAGNFLMGDAFGEGDPDELPVHKVEVSEFHMARHEVTKALWDKIRTWGIDNGYSDLPEGKGKGDNHPVYLINWDDIVKWCNARSEKDGLLPCYTLDGDVYRAGTGRPVCNGSANGYRLPTEAEWEKAARGGVSGKRFPWGDEISHTRANFNNQGKESYQAGSAGHHPTHGEGTSPVGSFEANGFGLYDMAGNLWEMCSDWHSINYYASSPAKDPRGPGTGSRRVLRGGSWFDSGEKCRIADRGINANPADRFLTYGFRLARGKVTPEATSVDATSKEGGRKETITDVAINCAPKSPTGNIFFAADRVSIHPDFTGGAQVGTSWTFLANKKIITAGGTFLSGDLISPRGGKMVNGPYFVLANEWEE